VKVLENLKTTCLRWNASGENCFLEVHTYPNGRLGLQIIGWYEEEGEKYEEPIATATVNLVDESCPNNEIWVKDYSENEGMVEQLVEWGVIELPSTASSRSGFVQILRFRMTPAFMLRVGDALVKLARKGVLDG